MSSPAPSPPPRLRASWTLLSALVLAASFCALYVAVDLRLGDAPPPGLTWTRIGAGAVLWLVVALVLRGLSRGRVGRGGPQE